MDVLLSLFFGTNERVAIFSFLLALALAVAGESSGRKPSTTRLLNTIAVIAVIVAIAALTEPALGEWFPF